MIFGQCLANAEKSRRRGKAILDAVLVVKRLV